MKVDTSPSIAGRIEQAFAAASQTTGTSFDYLMRTATRESNLDTQARASTSSAAGLFQFIESTWLEMVKERGSDFGLEKYADQISQTRSGRYTVDSPAMRKEILALRHDPAVSSYMAAAYTQKNAEALSSSLGRQPSSGELYIAHFLGAGGAERLIRLAEASPDTSAASRFPRQAAANRPIFYNKNGSARSAREVYSELVRQHQGVDTTTMVASAGNERVADAFSVLGYASKTDASKRVQVGWSATEASSPFEALFRTDPASAKGTFNTASFTAYQASETASTRMAPTGTASANDGVRGLFAAPVPVPTGRSTTGLTVDGKPLDLTAYLSYQILSKPKDLLPPV